MFGPESCGIRIAGEKLKSWNDAAKILEQSREKDSAKAAGEDKGRFLDLNKSEHLKLPELPSDLWPLPCAPMPRRQAWQGERHI